MTALPALLADRLERLAPGNLQVEGTSHSLVFRVAGRWLCTSEIADLLDQEGEPRELIWTVCWHALSTAQDLILEFKDWIEPPEVRDALEESLALALPQAEWRGEQLYLWYEHRGAAVLTLKPISWRAIHLTP